MVAMRNCCIVLLLTLLCGCATVKTEPARMIRVSEPFTVVVLPAEMLINKRGYCDRAHRIIYVRYNIGDDKPDFYALGHEVWHLKELGGCFHK